MKKYKVITTCHGFKRRYWEKGTIVELEDNENPPHHFVLVGSGEDVDSGKKNPVDTSPIAFSQMKQPVVVGGFASSLAAEQVKNPMIRDPLPEVKAKTKKKR